MYVFMQIAKIYIVKAVKKVKSTYDRRARIKALMKQVEAKKVCQNHSMWSNVISTNLNGTMRDFINVLYRYVYKY